MVREVLLILGLTGVYGFSMNSRPSRISPHNNLNVSASFSPSFSSPSSNINSPPSPPLRGETNMTFNVDLRGKTAFIAGVGDASGYGWAVAKHLSAAGARVLLGTWPPVLGIFRRSLEGGKLDVDMDLGDGRSMSIEKVYPIDAMFDCAEDVPEEVKNNKRYKGVGPFSIQEVADQVYADFGNIDILVHSLANGPEVTKPLHATSRKGYLSAISASAYSKVSFLSKFAKILNSNGVAISLTYIASERVIPGYGGGMSSAKAALESDTRVLAFELGRQNGIRVNTISAGPLKSRAANAIGNSGDKSFIDYAIDYSKANAPLQKDLKADNVGSAALFLLSPMSQAVTGTTLYVDNGLHVMGQAVDSASLQR